MQWIMKAGQDWMDGVFDLMLMKVLGGGAGAGKVARLPPEV